VSCTSVIFNEYGITKYDAKLTRKDLPGRETEKRTAASFRLLLAYSGNVSDEELSIRSMQAVV